jgi:hypothetical protein
LSSGVCDGDAFRCVSDFVCFIRFISTASAEAKMKTRRARIKFSWDLVNSFTNILDDEDDDDEEEDEDERLAYEEQVNRLRVTCSLFIYVYSVSVCWELTLYLLFSGSR